MALKQSAHARGIIPTPVAAGCEVVVCRASFALSADLAIGDIIEMMNLPAGHVPVDIILDTDDLGTTGAVAVGLLNSGKTDIDTTASGGVAWLTGGDVATAATGLRADAGGLRAMSRVVADQAANRPIGIKITTDTTAVSGIIGVTLLYRSA
jgi:hypothetical protein